MKQEKENFQVGSRDDETKCANKRQSKIKEKGNNSVSEKRRRQHFQTS